MTSDTKESSETKDSGNSGNSAVVEYFLVIVSGVLMDFIISSILPIEFRGQHTKLFVEILVYLFLVVGVFSITIAIVRHGRVKGILFTVTVLAVAIYIHDLYSFLTSGIVILSFYGDYRLRKSKQKNRPVK